MLYERRAVFAVSIYVNYNTIVVARHSRVLSYDVDRPTVKKNAPRVIPIRNSQRAQYYVSTD